MNYIELSANKRRMLVDSIQLFDAYRDARARLRALAGGMYWKKTGGTEYLIKLRGREGHGKSLGPRSPATEKIHDDFHAQKTRASDREKALRASLAEQARFNKAALINRVPVMAARVLHLLEERGLLGGSVIVVGTHALYAYEAAAGVLFQRELLATTDIDLLWDARTRLKLASGMTERGLLGLLQKADTSFEQDAKNRFRAVNRDGFMVDFIKQTPAPPWKKEPSGWGPGDLTAAEIPNLNWLLNAPKFEQAAIAEDGFPVPIVAPDPRAFAVFKHWLARDKTRDPVKAKRDAVQAVAVAEIVARYLPALPFTPDELRMFPASVVEASRKDLGKGSLPEE
ncbi:MAG: nucleotidyltransferase domain-containing protein [Betaproteobacteria bacterium]|nr:nucleotidyltransferase domain-containing protein [Betaproteobacteria bacterium]